MTFNHSLNYINAEAAAEIVGTKFTQHVVGELV